MEEVIKLNISGYKEVVLDIIREAIEKSGVYYDCDDAEVAAQLDIFFTKAVFFI